MRFWWTDLKAHWRRALCGRGMHKWSAVYVGRDPAGSPAATVWMRRCLRRGCSRSWIVDVDWDLEGSSE